MFRSLQKALWLLIISCMAGPAWAVPDFTKQFSIVLSSASPQAVDTSTSPMRLYFIRDNRVLSSTSTDGVTWFTEPGIRLSTATAPLIAFSTITACDLMRLDDNGYRMVYSAISAPNIYEVYSATSADGLAWANEAGARISATAGTFLGFPRLMERSSGDWRVYYLFDSNGGDDYADRQIGTSLSTDEGASWATGTVALNEPAADLELLVRTDNRIRLFLTQPLSGSTTASTLISALADGSSGLNFTLESGVRLSTDEATGALSYPAVFRSTETFRQRMLYSFTMDGSTIPHVYTAITAKADPTALTPAAINRTDANSSYTITGEVFGSTPTLALQKSGQTDIAGTGVVRNSDQSLTATFATNGQALGAWNLLVTNPDGAQSTLANALSITFKEGSVSITDNLMRLSQATVAQIAVEVFIEGTVKVAVHTLDGKLVRIIYEGDAALGTTTYTWDGKTAEGNNVASGTYIIKVDGPKLDSVKKIVVIR